MEQQQIKGVVEGVMKRHIEQLYDHLDRLHRQGIDDLQVQTALEQLGYEDLAEDYIEWQNDGEPVETDGAPRGIAPDPIDAPSYAALDTARAAHAKHFPQGGPKGQLA